MGRMKELFTTLQEAGRVIQESDPLAFENARQIIENAKAIAYGPTALPTITLGDQEYYVDERLRQLRNVANPHDFMDF
jgi:hypothetical protein